MKVLNTYKAEIYLLIMLMMYVFPIGDFVNWFGIILILLVGTLIVTKNRVLGVLFGSAILVISLFLIFALISELSEFTEYNKAFFKMLGVGSLMIIANIFFSIVLILKYSKVDKLQLSA